MSGLRQKRPRLRLDQESYKRLHRQVLERDGWRCQRCGSLLNLVVHHIHFRSRLGDDSEENLMTLCLGCHQEIHREVSVSGTGDACIKFGSLY